MTNNKKLPLPKGLKKSAHRFRSDMHFSLALANLMFLHFSGANSGSRFPYSSLSIFQKGGRKRRNINY